MGRINPDALFIGNPGETQYDAAIVGIGHRCGQPDLVVYDYDKLVAVFVKEGMTEDEATEWMDYNVVGAWHGPQTPIILYSYE